MSLIKCKECGKEISDKAEFCVNCGCPINKKKSDNNIRNNYLSIFIYVVLTSLILLVIFSNSIPSIVTRYSGNYSFKEFIEWINSSYLKRFEVTNPFIYSFSIVLGITFILMFIKVKMAKIIYGILTTGVILSIFALYILGYKLHIGMVIILISLFIMFIYNNNIMIDQIIKKEFWESIFKKIISIRELLNIEFFKRKIGKIAIVFGVVGIILISYIFVFSNNKEAIGPFLYVTEDNSLKFINSTMKKASEISSNYKEDIVQASISDNQRYFIYLKNENLYLVDTKTKDFKSEKIMSSVDSAYFVNDDKNIIILTKEKELYNYDFKDKKRLEKDVSSISTTVKDKIVYVKDETLYIRSVKNNVEDKKKISSSYSEYGYIIVSKDEKHLLYSINNEGKYDYYKYTISTGNNQKVLVNVDTLYDFAENFDSFIYTVKNGENKIDADKIFTDNYKDSDAKYVKQDYFLNYLYGYITYEEYRNLSEISYAVDRRNSVRELLKDGISFGNTYDVYYQSGDNKLKLASNISYLEEADIENKQIFYSVKTLKNNKKIDINDVDVYSYDDVIEDYFVFDLMYKKDGFDEEKITTLEKPYIIVYKEGKNDFYYEADIDDKTELYYVKLNSGKVKENKLISDNLYRLSYLSKYKGQTIFLENYNEDESTADLKMVKGGKVTNIAYDVLEPGYFYNYTIEDKYIGYHTIVDYDENTRNYYIYDGKSKKILKDITYTIPYNSKYMYVFKDCSDNSCDLYRYQNSKLDLIEYDVNNFSYEFLQQ